MFNCSPQECAYCRAPIASGERWVQEKIYEPPLVGKDARYRRYHTEVFAEQELSRWEKHQMELEVARTTARAA